MSDLKTLEEKINHIDKTVLGIDTTVKHFAEKLAETVRNNSTELDSHNNRIIGLERSFHSYDGSIKTLNRLILTWRCICHLRRDLDIHTNQ